jgi:O-antigen ligase
MAERTAPNQSRIEGGSALFQMLLGLVLLAPCPLGSVYPLAWAVIAGAVATLLLVHVIGVLRMPGAPAQRLGPMWSWSVPFAGTLAWIALQAAPMTPPAWHHPLWAGASSALATELDGAISLNPFETVSGLIRLLAYTGIFWLGLQLCRSAARAEAVFLSLGLAGFAYAVYGLFDKFSGANLVLWYPKAPQYLNTVTSTFFNRNSYAAYAGLGLVCASGMIIKFFSEPLSAPISRRAKAIELLEVLAGWRWLFLPGWVLLITALLLTGSRGGVLSSLAGLFALLIAVATTKAVQGRQALVIAGVVVAIGGAFVSFSGEQVAERLWGTSFDSDERAVIYDLTVQGIAQRPWLGTGYGTFEEAFRLFRDQRVHGLWDKAHNTYLENALELGVPTTALLVLGVGFLLLRCLIGVRVRQRDTIYPAIGVGATVLVAGHSLVDFSMQIPAVAATYALIMGAAVAQSWRRSPLPP